jgi:hypothetical protein
MSGKKSKRSRRHWDKATLEDIFDLVLPYALLIGIGLFVSWILIGVALNFLEEETAKRLVGLITLSPGFFFNEFLESGLIFAIVVAGLVWWYKKQN